MQKNDTQISGVFFEKRAPSPEKICFEKKNASSLFVQIRSSKQCAKLSKVNGSRDI